MDNELELFLKNKLENYKRQVLFGQISDFPDVEIINECEMKFKEKTGDGTLDEIMDMIDGARQEVKKQTREISEEKKSETKKLDSELSIDNLDKESNVDDINEVLQHLVPCGPLEQEKKLKRIKEKTKYSLSILKKQLESITKEKKPDYVAEKTEEDFSEDVKKKADELLLNPNILSEINDVLEYEMTGDEHNRLFYLIINESKRYSTQLVRPQGQTSAGKNEELKWFKKFWSNVHEFASSTSSHFVRKVMDKKIETRESIIIHTEERENIGRFSFNIDQLYGTEKITVGFSVRDGNEWKPVDIDITGPVVFYTTSTMPPDEHRKARGWITNPDESIEQNKRISDWRKWKDSLPQEITDKHEEDMKVVRCALQKLETFDRIILPYLDFTVYQHKETDDRRREENFNGVVKLVAHLHQRQRPVVEINGKKILVSLPQDLFIAYEISKSILELGRGELTERQKEMIRLVEQLQIPCRDEAGKSGGEKYFTINDCKKNNEWKWEYQVTYNNFIDMCKKGKILRTKKGRELLFTIQKQDDVSPTFIKISSYILNLEKLGRSLIRHFINNPDVCSDIINQMKEKFTLKIPNPFKKIYTFTYEDGFIKRVVKEVNPFFSVDYYEDIFLKSEKESNHISNKTVDEHSREDNNHNEKIKGS